MATKIVEFPKRLVQQRTTSLPLREPNVIAHPSGISQAQLYREYRYLDRNYLKWDCLNDSGEEVDDKRARQYVDMSRGAAFAYGEEFSDAEIRRRCATMRRVIRDRCRLVEWLETRGATDDDLRSAEEALHFLKACNDGIRSQPFNGEGS